MIRVMLIGPLPPPMGGDTRHFKTLFDDLARNDRFRIKLINTSRQHESSNPVKNFTVATKTLLSVISNLIHTDIISFHASDRGMLLFGPFVVGLGKLTGKPTILRLFGGSFGDFYTNQNGIKKLVIRRMVLSADVVLLQTRRAVEQLRRHASGCLEWFSTYVRTSPGSVGQSRDTRHDEKKACEKFVFLGHLWRTKGVDVILNAAADIPPGCSIDLYGPTDEYTAAEIRERGLGRVRYRGFLQHAEVDATLREYDCLVLPTFHPGEGYPGVIAEAFAQGLPVITTSWLAIPEIVDDACGILIPPDDTAAFVSAIAALHAERERWRQMCDGAHRKAALFDHEVWSRKFESICEELVG